MRPLVVETYADGRPNVQAEFVSTLLFSFEMPENMKHNFAFNFSTEMHSSHRRKAATQKNIFILLLLRRHVQSHELSAKSGHGRHYEIKFPD